MSSQTWYVYLLAFGSNLGDRASHLERGRSFLASKGTFLALSRWQETTPLPSAIHNTANHENYLNGVGEFITDLSPRKLYDAICEVENAVGHRRDRRWAPRELDIDIVFAGVANTSQSRFVDSKPLRYSGECGLQIPHAGFWERPFLIDMMTREIPISVENLKIHSTTHWGAS